MPHPHRPLAFLTILLALGALSALAELPPAAPLVLGTAVGDVTPTSAVLWAGTSTPGGIYFEIDTDPDFPNPRREAEPAAARTDFTAQHDFEDLKPATTYYYRAYFEDPSGALSEKRGGSFTTPPRPEQAVDVRFRVGGDVGGQGFCRRPEKGYEIFEVMAKLGPDFFIANGDMIYADGDCPARRDAAWSNVPGDFPSIQSPSVDWTDHKAVRKVFDAHWRYNRVDPHQQAFLAHVPYFAQWDDHEVINDFGAAWPSWSKQPERAGFENLVEQGRRAFFAYSPIRGHDDERWRVYRSFTWGSQLEFFLLDGRTYRSRNDLVDRPEHDKTLLGKEQLAWLTRGLKESKATWKVVSSDVPLSVPTGSQADLYGRDAFADGDRLEPGFADRTGFESELLAWLREMDAADVENLVVVVTDVHFAMSLRYAVDLDGDGDFLIFHEFLNGPLNAFTMPTPLQLDPTLRPTILYGEGGVFNFSAIHVERGADGKSRLTAEIRGEDGEVRPGSRVVVEAR